MESDAPTEADLAGSESTPAGLKTWGEFGPVLTIVLGDSTAGGLTWSRWQAGESGLEAVFSYRVPRSASHYQIDFCCYQESADNPSLIPFRDRPGYHGEIFVNPETGAIDRISLEPEFASSSPILSFGMAVEYGHVGIGDLDAICPTRSIAVSEIRVFDPAADGFSTTRYLNRVRFVDYHKFGSTARIVSGP